MGARGSISESVLRWIPAKGSSTKGPGCSLADAETQFAHDHALANAEARVALYERQLIELNHRFANTLQVISSSLKMDSRRAPHEDTKAALDAAATRVYAAARLHRQLLEHEKDQCLDLNLFLSDLASELNGSTGLRCLVEGESISVSGDMGFKLAAAVTELVLNARKHAYDGKDGGVVHITCHRVGTSQLRVSVLDNGKGLPKDFQPESAHGIGMSLIVAAAKQLNGELNVHNKDGACFTLIVPIEQML